MKRKLAIYSTVVIAGAFALMIGLLIHGSLPRYAARAREDFAGPDRTALIVDLYETIEGGSPSELGLVDMDIHSVDEFGFPRTRALPRDLIPKEFEFPWIGAPKESGSPFWWMVLAHYDAVDQLQAIEFYGSRYGAFISRDPDLTPRFAGDLERLSGGPIYITARITGDPG